MFLHLFRFLSLCLLLYTYALEGALHGKIDLGPTLLSVDVLQSGKTEETLHMKGLKGDFTLLFYQGLYIKPGFLTAWGDGELTSGGFSVGYYIPVTKKLKLMPNVGVTFGYLRTRVDLEIAEGIELTDLKERFRSSSPYIGMEFSYSITSKWTLMGLYQYAWSHTHTKIKPLVSDKSHSCGPNYSLGLEYSVDDHWAVNLGLGYNITLSKEKHGIRGKGAKIGLAYYF